MSQFPLLAAVVAWAALESPAAQPTPPPEAGGSPTHEASPEPARAEPPPEAHGSPESSPEPARAEPPLEAHGSPALSPEPARAEPPLEAHGSPESSPEPARAAPPAEAEGSPAPAASAEPARAEPPPVRGAEGSTGDDASSEPPAPAPDAPLRFVAGLELGSYLESSYGESVTAFSPVLTLGVEARDGLWLSVDWGLSTLRLSGPGGDTMSTVRSANAVLTAARDLEVLGLGVRAGLGFILPLADLPEGFDARVPRAAHAYAAGLRGLYAPWLWAANHTGLVLPVTLAPIRRGRFVVGANAALALVLPFNELGDAASDGREDVFLRLAADAAFSHHLARLGARAWALFMPTVPLDQVQLAVAPFLEVDIGSVTAGVQYVTAVDEPLAATTSWGLQLNVTTRF